MANKKENASYGAGDRNKHGDRPERASESELTVTYKYGVITVDVAVPFTPGYGAFSASQWNAKAVTAYISDQAVHHRKFPYQEELRELLKRRRVAYDES
jgi:hypothetical protein